MSLSSDRERRRLLAEDYATRRRKHAARAGVAQQLKRLTHRLLRAEVADDKARARRKTRPDTPLGAIAGDLDLFLNR